MKEFKLGNQTFCTDKEGTQLVFMEKLFGGVLYNVKGRFDTPEELKAHMKAIENESGLSFEELN